MLITCLEMTAPSQLVAARLPPALEMDEIGPTSASLVRETYVRIWEGLASGGRMRWSEAQWEEELSRHGVRAWLARVDGDVAGLVELEAETNGDVGIVVFGLVPEFVGKRFGGAFLTLATETAWKLRRESAAGSFTKRVWVQTSSDDHPHALPNYERRGFRVFRIDDKHDPQAKSLAGITPRRRI
jgi:GNAT superfamily N-acetyltransferase